MESKHEKFIRLRDARVPKLLHAIKLMGNLAGPAYESTPEEAADMIGNLENAVAGLAQKFGLTSRPGEVQSDDHFTLTETPAAAAREEVEPVPVVPLPPKRRAIEIQRSQVRRAQRYIRDDKPTEALKCLRLALGEAQ